MTSSLTSLMYVVITIVLVFAPQSQPNNKTCTAPYYGMGNGDGVLDRRCFHLQSQLSKAAYDGDVKGIKRLLRQGANADSYAGDRFPPLFSAASKGKTGAARILLDNGANIDRKYTLNGSALFAAIYGNHVETVALLISRGADVNLRNGDETPLKIARANGYDGIVVLLKKAGARE